MLHMEDEALDDERYVGISKEDEFNSDANIRKHPFLADFLPKRIVPRIVITPPVCVEDSLSEDWSFSSDYESVHSSDDENKMDKWELDSV
jgi:hypothetical protein